MKTAVVFYGSMRELELGSKSWHILGEEVDYFAVTWDIVNKHYSDPNPSYRFDPSTFPVPIQSQIIVNFDKYLESFQSLGIPPYINVSTIFILYHWSLIRNLPNISSYDKIIISRTDLFLTKRDHNNWEPIVHPGKVTFVGYRGCGVLDWILTTDPAGLEVLHDLYYNAITNKDFLGDAAPQYLHNIVNSNPEKFFYDIDNDAGSVPGAIIIRPNHSADWAQLPYGPVLAFLIMRHSFQFEITVNGMDTQKTAEEHAIQSILATPNFNP